jgi:von Willebrand factor type A domain
VTPSAALVGLIVAAPLLALAVAEQSLRRVCALVGIQPPGRHSALVVAISLALLALFVGLAAAQPVISTRQAIKGRVDAETFFVFDISRSMSARPAATAPTRLARARAVAKELSEKLGDVPIGVASFTDRLLPHLFPTVSRNTLLATIDRSLGIDRPAATLPWGDNLGTKLASIADLATSGYYTPRVRQRAAVVFTDGETLAEGLFGQGSAGATQASFAEALARGNVHVVFVRLWGPNERVYQQGLVNPAYVPDPSSETQFQAVATELRTRVYSPDEVGAAAADLRQALGRGPTGVRGYDLRSSELTPYVFAFAAVPLLFLLWRRNLPPTA